ncbi:MAG: HpcH/HpaI aldolase/citrate lyase family protein [Rhizobiaceae bacterium]
MVTIPIRENTFKRGLAARETQLGLWSGLSSHIGAEIIADAGYDWLLIDGEHGPVEASGILPILQAAAKSHCCVRVPWNDKVLIKRALDIGAETIFVPFVQNGEEAKDVVSACKYPPYGVRGVAGSTRSSRYGRTTDYIHTADEEICVIVQIETADAMEQIEDIAAIDGLDGMFIGPADLSASMGHRGNPGHEEVQAALKSAVERINAAGKPAGILCGSTADAKKFIDWGYTFVAIGVDIPMFAKAVDTALADIKALI